MYDVRFNKIETAKLLFFFEIYKFLRDLRKKCNEKGKMSIIVDKMQYLVKFFRKKLHKLIFFANFVAYFGFLCLESLQKGTFLTKKPAK